jgi:hypothetical protein
VVLFLIVRAENLFEYNYYPKLMITNKASPFEVLQLRRYIHRRLSQESVNEFDDMVHDWTYKHCKTPSAGSQKTYRISSSWRLKGWLLDRLGKARPKDCDMNLLDNSCYGTY